MAEAIRDLIVTVYNKCFDDVWIKRPVEMSQKIFELPVRADRYPKFTITHDSRSKIPHFIQIPIDCIDILDGLTAVEMGGNTDDNNPLRVLRYFITVHRRKSEERIVNGDVDLMKEGKWDSDDTIFAYYLSEYQDAIVALSIQQQCHAYKQQIDHIPVHPPILTHQPIEFQPKEKQLKELIETNSQHIHRFIKNHFSQIDLMKFALKLERFIRFPFESFLDFDGELGDFEKGMTTKELILRFSKIVEPVKSLIVFVNVWPFTFKEKDFVDLFVFNRPKKEMDSIEYNTKELKDFGLKLECFCRKLKNIMVLRRTREILVELYSEYVVEEEEDEEDPVIDYEKEAISLNKSLMRRIRETENLKFYLLEPQRMDFESFEMKHLLIASLLDDVEHEMTPFPFPILKDVEKLMNNLERRMILERYDPFWYVDPDEMEEEINKKVTKHQRLLKHFAKLAAIRKFDFFNPELRNRYHKDFKFFFANQKLVLRTIDEFEFSDDQRFETAFNTLLRDGKPEQNETESYGNNMFWKMLNNQKRKWEINEKKFHKSICDECHEEDSGVSTGTQTPSESSESSESSKTLKSLKFSESSDSSESPGSLKSLRSSNPSAPVVFNLLTEKSEAATKLLKSTESKTIFEFNWQGKPSSEGFYQREKLSHFHQRIIETTGKRN